MKWTGADLIVQLDEGWEIDEIASATGLGIAEVRRLVRDERYRMRQQIKEEEVANKRTEVANKRTEVANKRTEVEKETTEAVDIHAWNMISVLAEQPGSPAVATIASRAESGDPKWAHYESIPVEEVEGDWHRRTTALYRLREGTGWDSSEVADPKSKVVNHADQAARIASLERELERVNTALVAVHRECERREYGSDDKKPAVEKVREIIDYTEEVEHLEARQAQQIKELETCRVLAADTRETWKERAEAAEAIQSEVSKLLGEHFDLNDCLEAEQIARMLRQLIVVSEDHEAIEELLRDGGNPAVGARLAPTIEKLLEHSIELQEVRRLEADGPTEDDETPLDRRLEDLAHLEFEIANLYAVRATDDFAELEQRCWDLKQAKKHYRRREVLMQEWCREEGR